VLDLRVFVVNEAAHDRFLYLPSVGFALLVGLALERLRLGRFTILNTPAKQAFAVLVLAAALVFGTSYQSLCYSSNQTFFAYNAAAAPHNDHALVNYATFLRESGEYEPAIRLYQQVLKDDPGFWSANYGLGRAYYHLGNLDDAARYLQRAIEIDANPPEEYLYLGLVELRKGDLEKAAANIRQAITIKPKEPGFHFALGMVLKLKGDLPGALREFRAELALNPTERHAAQQAAEVEALLKAKK
jgi:tetratricopeptide (TPR) repeat protein